MCVGPGNGLHCNMDIGVLFHEITCQYLQLITLGSHTPYRQVARVGIATSTSTSTTGGQNHHEQRQWCNNGEKFLFPHAVSPFFYTCLKFQNLYYSFSYRDIC